MSLGPLSLRWAAHAAPLYAEMVTGRRSMGIQHKVRRLEALCRCALDAATELPDPTRAPEAWAELSDELQELASWVYPSGPMDAEVLLRELTRTWGKSDEAIPTQDPQAARALGGAEMYAGLWNSACILGVIEQLSAWGAGATRLGLRRRRWEAQRTVVRGELGVFEESVQAVMKRALPEWAPGCQMALNQPA